ncbi:zinc-binding dehydrogenase [Dactylosporangium sp. AC04546]|uniref:zinc-binding dehydrogenase n=1 Tax=Dactylosporangium sp. AC04546 TaxID=2862460 RepID=UPI001EE14544|nr:zinc-binding dehydrogenase [Dactylosporangium sp. AC04546]WVK86065.1 zinc-binding dehydrogenase [Dactylosporangium sp. AC04546]
MPGIEASGVVDDPNGTDLERGQQVVTTWLVRDFYPIGYLPRGVRLSAYGGESDDLPQEVLQRCLDRIAADEMSLGPVHTYPLDDIRQAHTDLEQGTKVGKLVGITR